MGPGIIFHKGANAIFDRNFMPTKRSRCEFSRKGVDSVEAKINDHSSDLVVSYKILGIELSVRSTHIDKSHLHMMPPFTFLLPTAGINMSRMDMEHQIELYSPQDGLQQHNYNLSTQASDVIR